MGLATPRFGPPSWCSNPFLPTPSTGGTRPPERKVATMKGYVVQKGSRFYAVIYGGVDPITGRERRRWHPAGTDRNEANELAARLAAQASPTQASAGLTVATFMLRRWLPAKRVSLRPSTWDGYRRLVELHVVPRLGGIPLRRLQPSHLEALYSELLASGRRDGLGGLNDKTVLEVHGIIRKALADARRRGLVSSNVAEHAEAPKRRRPQSPLRAWNAKQLQEFLATARSHRLFPAFWLAANTGMRRSEPSGSAGVTSTWSLLDSASIGPWSRWPTSYTIRPVRPAPLAVRSTWTPAPSRYSAPGATNAGPRPGAPWAKKIG